MIQKSEFAIGKRWDIVKQDRHTNRSIKSCLIGRRDAMKHKGNDRLSNIEIGISLLLLILPLMFVSFIYFAKTGNSWFYILCCYPIFPLLIFARFDQRRQQIKTSLMREINGKQDIDYDFNKTFPLQMVMKSCIFPEINTIYSDSQATPFVAQKGNVSFSQINCAVGCNTTGVNRYLRLGAFIFFKLNVKLYSQSQTIIILPRRWKFQFGLKKALYFMGYWPPVPKPVKIEYLNQQWVYTPDPLNQLSSSNELESILYLIKCFLDELKLHGLGNICISINSNAIHVAMPVKLKISIFNSKKNIQEQKQYLSQIDAVIQGLGKIEMQLKHR